MSDGQTKTDGSGADLSTSPPRLCPAKLRAAREVCPACGRKGLGYAGHAHALGWKDYDRASCRYCHKTFRLKSPNAGGDCR